MRGRERKSPGRVREKGEGKPDWGRQPPNGDSVTINAGEKNFRQRGGIQDAGGGKRGMYNDSLFHPRGRAEGRIKKGGGLSLMRNRAEHEEQDTGAEI